MKRRYLLLFFLCTVTISNSTYGQQTLGGQVFTPRMRVILDNDFSGDPDGLFQLAHLLLSPSVEIRAIIGSHLKAGDGFDPSKVQADNATQKARELVGIMGLKDTIPIIAGSNTAMLNDSSPVKSAAVDFIIREALRTDTQLPLYILCGAGLTEIASACLTNPQIANKLTLVWIGGPEHSDLAFPPPRYSITEYNTAIDIAAVQAIFNRSTLPIWQVPRNAYRQALLPYSQLLLKVKPQGKLGNYLYETIERVRTLVEKFKLNIGETYVMGDSSLVLLTALQSSFEADPSSSIYAIKITPTITGQGTYTYNTQGRPMRVYTHLDIPLMFNDFFAKLELIAK